MHLANSNTEFATVSNNISLLPPLHGFESTSPPHHVTSTATFLHCEVMFLSWKELETRCVRPQVSFVDQRVSHRDQTLTHISHYVYCLILSSNSNLEKYFICLLTSLLAQPWVRRDRSEERRHVSKKVHFEVANIFTLTFVFVRK